MIFSEEFNSALAFFKAFPNYIKDASVASAVWVWEVLQGDFNEEQTTAQMTTGMVISMIPLVDQICDIRDIIANVKKINQDTRDTMAWVALILTLIGLFPVLGSLVKGCLKILFAPIRRLYLHAGNKITQHLLTQAVEKGIKQLHIYLDNPAVQKTLKALNIHNPFKYLAKNLETLQKDLTSKQLCKILDDMLEVINTIFQQINPVLPEKMVKETQGLWEKLLRTRHLSDRYIAEALSPVNDLLERFIYRLHHESDDLFRAVHETNFHKINRIKDKEIIKQTDKLPSYYQLKGNTFEALDNLKGKHKELIAQGYPDISENGFGPLENGFNTFHDLVATELPAGTKLARVIDPKSADNSTCWMRIEEFEKLISRAEWREKYAVKTEWNGNGEYVTYTVPEGKTLKVWEGKAASQEIKDTDYYIPGGAVQIVVDPRQLERSYVSGRKPTNWGYGEINYQDNGITYLGVPELTKNIGYWYK